MSFTLYDASHQPHNCHVLHKYNDAKTHKNYILFVQEENSDEVISARIDDQGHLFPLNNEEWEDVKDIFNHYLSVMDLGSDGCMNCVCVDGNCVANCESCRHN